MYKRFFPLHSRVSISEEIDVQTFDKKKVNQNRSSSNIFHKKENRDITMGIYVKIFAIMAVLCAVSAMPINEINQFNQPQAGPQNDQFTDNNSGYGERT